MMITSISHYSFPNEIYWDMQIFEPFYLGILPAPNESGHTVSKLLADIISHLKPYLVPPHLDYARES